MFKTFMYGYPVRSLAALLALALPAAADTLKVPQDFESIQAAIDAAAAGDTVSVSPGTYTENLTVPSGKDGLVLTGKGNVFVDAHVDGDGITVLSSQVTISKLTIRHADGAGVLASVPVEGLPALTQLNLDSVTIINADGPGVDLIVDAADLRNCTLQGCDGGVQIIGAGASLSKVEVLNDNSTGIAIEGNGAQVVSCTVDTVGGAGVAVLGNTALVDKSKFANVNGPMIQVQGNNAQISKNQGIDGPTGIEVSGDGAVVDNNTLAGFGGALISVGGATATVTSNKLSNAGGDGIQVEGEALLVSKNQVSDVGGNGIACAGAGGTVERNKVSRTVGSGYQLFTETATISKNQATACGIASGAGLLVVGSDNVVDSNTARDSASSGLFVRGSTNSITKNKLLDNTINGILIDSDPIAKPEGGAVISLSNDLESNTCSGNAGQGLLNEGVSTLIEKNKLTGNRLDLSNATLAGASLVDQGGNNFDTGGLTTEPEILE